MLINFNMKIIEVLLILDVTGNISDTDFQKRVTDILKPIAPVIGKPKITNYKSLPDDPKKFTEM